MERETNLNNTVALLATGDEISQGDILNTNAKEISLRLTQQDIHVRMHMVTPDTIVEIEQAINFLLTHHDALIITGGLGPTSDDLTRYALAKVLNEELVFSEETWNTICERLKRYGYDVPPQSNRQQALFPQHATILPNPNGSAAGCYIIKNAKIIFMLPGPPVECLPMMETVTQTLIKHGYQQIVLHKNWYLFGVSEGQIAEELDAITAGSDCVTGYRLFYPYIEFKLRSENKKDFEKLVTKVEAFVQPYIIQDGSRIASDILCEKIISEKIKISLHDLATYGALQAKLTTPQTISFLKFTETNDKKFHLEISGLKEYWQEIPDQTHTSLKIIFYINGTETQKEITLPFRGSRVIQFAVEYICKKLLAGMTTQAVGWTDEGSPT